MSTIFGDEIHDLRGLTEIRATCQRFALCCAAATPPHTTLHWLHMSSLQPNLAGCFAASDPCSCRVHLCLRSALMPFWMPCWYCVSHFLLQGRKSNIIKIALRHPGKLGGKVGLKSRKSYIFNLLYPRFYGSLDGLEPYFLITSWDPDCLVQDPNSWISPKIDKGRSK